MPISFLIPEHNERRKKLFIVMSSFEVISRKLNSLSNIKTAYEGD